MQQVRQFMLMPQPGNQARFVGAAVFASLELPTQAAIESEFLEASGEQLAPLLAECSNYFIQARYAYEQIGGSYNLSGIRTLAKGLLDAVKAFGTKNP